MGFIGTLKEQPAEATGHLCIHNDGRNQSSAPYENLYELIYTGISLFFLSSAGLGRLPIFVSNVVLICVLLFAGFLLADSPRSDLRFLVCDVVGTHCYCRNAKSNAKWPPDLLGVTCPTRGERAQMSGIPLSGFWI